MCGIFGWVSYDDHVAGPHRDQSFIQAVVNSANARGRDGWGLRCIPGAGSAPSEYRSISGPYRASRFLHEVPRVLANFRAAPSTELQTEVEFLQPYDGFVHNGTIANDKELRALLFPFGSKHLPIDSMVIPYIFQRYPKTSEGVAAALAELRGSYALLWFFGDDLWWACNYKPLYTHGNGQFRTIASSLDQLPFWDRAAIPPYTFGRTKPDGTLEVLGHIPRRQTNRVLVAASAGLDSTVVAYMLKSQGYLVTLVYFNYGQLAAGNERRRVKQLAYHGHFSLVELKLPEVMSGTLTEGKYHADGHAGAEYAHDWVSARNLLMLATLTAYAESNDYGYIAFGGNLEEAGSYPDNEDEFARRFGAVLPFAVQNGVKIELLAPLSGMMKHEIVAAGAKLGVPWDLTWSCYSNKETPCGECAPCHIREQAFQRSGVVL